MNLREQRTDGDQYGGPFQLERYARGRTLHGRDFLRGYGTSTTSNITLSLGENYVLNVVLSEEATTLDEVVVTALRTKFTTEKTGAVTNITNAQIDNLPTVTRSIMDVTRLSPYGGNGMSFVGTDGRTANFTVDGANFNNNFGLSSALPGGGNPISIEAIEELQVVIAPYDVRQTNFIGGGVNAITKSGTNTLRASAYTYHRNENMRGDLVRDRVIEGARERDRNTTYGFTAGGPIIKNKLFFFVNAEMAKSRLLLTVGGPLQMVWLIRIVTFPAPRRVISSAFLILLGISMVMKPVHIPTSRRMRATTSCLPGWTGTSRTGIAWRCGTTTPKISRGDRLTPPLWTGVPAYRRPECRKHPCRLPIQCTLKITWYTPSRST